MNIRYLIIIIFLSSTLCAQKIGEKATPRPPEIFPDNSWGVDIMFGEGGFGLGTFFRKNLNTTITAFADLSISEAKDDREVEYIDYFGNTFTFGKKNRIFLIPVNMGLQYRLFANSLDDNLRPYINFGAGPSVVITTPYEKEFFSAFGDAVTKLTAGGYLGIGANFGLNKSSLVGINFRYYHIQFFDKGIEGLNNRYQKTLGGFYLTINIGVMY